MRIGIALLAGIVVSGCATYAGTSDHGSDQLYAGAEGSISANVRSVYYSALTPEGNRSYIKSYDFHYSLSLPGRPPLALGFLDSERNEKNGEGLYARAFPAPRINGWVAFSPVFENFYFSRSEGSWSAITRSQQDLFISLTVSTFTQQRILRRPPSRPATRKTGPARKSATTRRQPWSAIAARTARCCTRWWTANRRWKIRPPAVRSLCPTSGPDCVNARTSSKRTLYGADQEGCMPAATGAAALRRRHQRVSRYRMPSMQTQAAYTTGSDGS